MGGMKGVKFTYLIHSPVGMASGFQGRVYLFFKFYVYKCLHICICARYVQYSWRPEEVTGIPIMEVAHSCELSHGC